MKKFRLLLLLMLLCAVLTVSAHAADIVAYPVIGGNIYFNVDTGAIVNADKTVTRADIPSNIARIPVTSISGYAFRECTMLISVTIPDSVSSIGPRAFQGCTSLTSITIPSTVTHINDYMFEKCTSLTSVTIPSTVTSIGDHTFDWCTSLAAVAIPDSVISIGDYAFRMCTSLTSVTISGSADAIGRSAFQECISLTSITIPNSVTSIGDNAFDWCTSLTSVTIPGSVNSIGDNAFYACSSLRSVIIPDSVTSIGNFVFWKCTSLTSITIPNSVTTIGISAFQECTSLTSVTIPDSVLSIEDNAFYRCSSLVSITLPESVNHIGRCAFKYTTLTEAFFRGVAPAVIQSLDKSDASFNANTTLYYIDDNSGWTDSIAYNAGTGTWNGYTLKIWSPMPFTDIVAGETFYNDILWAYERGLMNGKTATTFERKTNLSRQQVWRVLSRAVLGVDVGSMANAKAWAIEQGVSDGSRPGEDATREEMVTMLWIAYGKPSANKADFLDQFPDVNSVSADCRSAMEWSVENGIIGGTTSGTLHPKGSLTRGAFAAILHRYLG